MVLTKNNVWLAVVFFCSSLASASDSMALEEACYGDVDLTEYVVEMIGNGSSELDVVSSDEAKQISSIILNDENAALSVAEKLDLVLRACSEGRILRDKNVYFLGTLEDKE